jgi:hypothetical protein
MQGQPIVFISHFAVKPGHADALRELWSGLIAELEVSKPATTAQVGYLNGDGSRLSIVHVFPDTAALAAHFLGAGERSRAAYEHIVPAGWEVYGSPDAANLAGLREEAVAAGVSLTVEPEVLGGFVRAAGR